MKGKFKKITFSIIGGIILLLFSPRVSATSAGLSINKSSVYIGDTFTVTISGINGRVKVSSSTNVTLSATGSQFVDGSVSITGTAKSVGNATITVTPEDATTSSADPVEIDAPSSRSINVIEKPQTNNNTTTKPPTTVTNNTTTTKNNNAYLSKLQVNQEGLSPNFNRGKISYAITVGANVNSLKVTAIPEASTSKVSVSGNTNLKNGDNKIYITVTAQDGTKKVYTITVTKTADVVKSNSYLQNLIVENATMSPEFSKEVFEYDCGTVGASIESLKILAFGENENVKVEITGNDKLVDGDNNINVKVTSEDGTTTKEYVIKVKKDSSLVEENKIQEINSPEATENDNQNKILVFLKNIWHKIKNHITLVIMALVILIQFVFNIYLLMHKDKKRNKKNQKSELMKTLEKTESIISDKNFGKDKKSKRIGAKEFKNKD